MPPSTPPPNDAESSAEPAGNEPDGPPNEASENRLGETYSDILRTELQALAATLRSPPTPPED